MKKLRVLIVEDDKEKLGPLLDRLSDSAFDPDVRNTKSDAVKRVQGAAFDVIFIDLQLTKEETGKEPFYEGIALGEQLRKLAPEAAIVMYSGSIPRGEETRFPHYKDCIEVSMADAVLARSELFSISSQQLQARIEGWLESRRRLAAGIHVHFASDVRTQAACEVFETKTLNHILPALIRNMNYFEVAALQAGYSGAAILKVKASQFANYSAPSHLVIKVSKSDHALDDELHRLPAVGSHFDARAVVPSGQEPIHRDGVYGIAIREVRNMMLLREFLMKRGLTIAHKGVLTRIIGELLIAPAKEAVPSDKLGLTTFGFKLRATAGSEICDVLSAFSGLKSVLQPADIRAIKASRIFVDLVLKGVWSFTAQGRFAARLHGDFHCRNIFVSAEDGPLLIDFGRSEIYPRLFDCAALDADLVLSVLDSEDGEDHKISNVQRWFQDVTSLFPFGASSSEYNETTKVGWFRQSLISAMVKELPSVLATEYAETLVFQYLRYLRFPNITFPKKVLAARLVECLTKKYGLRGT